MKHIVNISGGKDSAACYMLAINRLGTRAGFPDLAFRWCGKFYALEVKTVTGKQQPSQLTWETYINNAGDHYAVVRSIDDTKAAFAKWGVDQKRIAGV